MDKKWQRHFILDVEADGPHPLDFNMINFGLVNVLDPDRGFYRLIQPLHMNGGGIDEARAVSGVTWDNQLIKGADIAKSMRAAQDWLTDCSGVARVTLWSDNPAFDWQFWNAYCHRFCNGFNVAGFSARRIGDLDAGRRKEPFNTNAFKKRRQTAHTHNPEDDARGNAEALRWVLEQMGQA
jgi:hypothetical protein